MVHILAARHDRKRVDFIERVALSLLRLPVHLEESGARGALSGPREQPPEEAPASPRRPPRLCLREGGVGAIEVAQGGNEVSLGPALAEATATADRRGLRGHTARLGARRWPFQMRRGGRRELEGGAEGGSPEVVHGVRLVASQLVAIVAVVVEGRGRSLATFRGSQLRVHRIL